MDEHSQDLDRDEHEDFLQVRDPFLIAGYKAPFDPLGDLSYYIRKAMPWWIRRPYDWVADRVWRRYHILKLSYGYGWMDIEHQLLYANFDLLTSFVEKEFYPGPVDWTHDEEHRRVATEIEVLYKWWKKDRPARVDPIDTATAPRHAPWKEAKEKDPMGQPLFEQGDCIDPPEVEAAWEKACEESNRLEELWWAEDQAMLHRLIEIRQYLWT